MVTFNGLYNFAGGGTEVITGNGSETIPSFTEIINNNPKTFFSGQFTNISMELIHVNIKGVSGQTVTMHKHDLRPRESIDITNVPIGEIDVLIGSTNKIGFHGMGVLWTTEDEDEYAVFASKSSITEGGSLVQNFNTDSYTEITPTTATTQDIVDSASTDKDFALFKVIINTDAAGSLDLFWTDGADANVEEIGRYQFSGAGTFVLDCDWLRNPNRQDGKLRCTQTLANWRIVAIGHMVSEGQ